MILQPSFGNRHEDTPSPFSRSKRNPYRRTKLGGVYSARRGELRRPDWSERLSNTRHILLDPSAGDVSVDLDDIAAGKQAVRRAVILNRMPPLDDRAVRYA